MSEGETEIKQENPQQTETDKKNQVIRILYQEKQTLKALLEKETNEHQSDVHRLTEEKNSIQEEYKKLAESYANMSLTSSPEQEAKIDHMNEQINSLTMQLRQAKIELNDQNINKIALERQLDQNAVTIATLEDDITRLENDRYQHAITKTQVSTLEDELRNKNRQIKELETTAKWAEHELQKVKGQLAQAGARTQILTRSKCDTVSIEPLPEPIEKSAREAFQKIEGSGDDAAIVNFFHSLPKRIRDLEDENENLLQLANKYKHQFARVKSPSANSNNDKLKETLRKALISNREKSEAIAKLKNVCERQHAALQRLAGQPANESPSASLRLMIQTLATCPAEDRATNATIAEKLLDAILGVKM